jgi:hypothetical protein
MTREEFIKVLEEKGYSYEIEGDKIVVTHDRNVWLNSLSSLPPGVEFRNGGSVDLDSLTSLPSGVVFRNGHNVYLDSLTSLPPGVVFSNKYSVYLKSLTGNWFGKWSGNIEGIGSNRLLNKMITLGLFDKNKR